MSEFKDILSFCFGSSEADNFGKSRKVWFAKNEVFDRTVKEGLLRSDRQAVKGDLNFWQELPQICLALIIVVDQFPGNIFSNIPKAFATDNLAKKYPRRIRSRIVASSTLVYLFTLRT